MPHAAPVHRSTPRPPPMTANQLDNCKFYNSARWRKLRKAFLSEYPLCEFCKAKNIITPATQVDHREPRRKRPDLALCWKNLRSLCGSCHSKRTARDQARGRRHP